MPKYSAGFWFSLAAYDRWKYTPPSSEIHSIDMAQARLYSRYIVAWGAAYPPRLDKPQIKSAVMSNSGSVLV